MGQLHILLLALFLSIVMDKCKPQCAWQCQNNSCNVDREGAWVCSEGCLEGLTGKYCQELCPQKCVACEQFSFTCTSCLEGYKGQDCSERLDISTTVLSTQQEMVFSYTTVCPNASCKNTAHTTTPNSEITRAKSGGASKIGSVLPFTMGIAAAVIFFTLTLCVAYKMKNRDKSHERPGKCRSPRSSGTDRYSGMYYTYDYIDDVSLALYHSDLHGHRSEKPDSDESYPNHQRGTHTVPESEIEA